MQIVGFTPGLPEDPASLRIADSGTVFTERLDAGNSLEYGLGNRHCAGTVNNDVHEPCTNETAPYCQVHTTIWPCARCRGECAMPLETCYEDHVIYLAAFEPSTFKVGVTRRGRLETRLAEQGARRGAKIHTVENGRIARQREAEIAMEIPDRVEVETKIAGLGETLDVSQWKRLLEPYTVHETFNFEYGLAVGQQPIRTTTATGRIRGTRGRILVLDRGETTYAVDLRDLLGYEIQAENPDIERQSSLRAF